MSNRHQPRAFLLAICSVWATHCVVTGVEPSPFSFDDVVIEKSDAGVDSGAQAGASGSSNNIGPCGDPSSKIADNECEECMSSNCCDASALCFGDSACLTALKCVAQCTDNDCISTCLSSLKGDSLANALTQKSCWGSDCISLCPESAKQNNLVGSLAHISGAVDVDCSKLNQCANQACGDCNANTDDYCETNLLTASNCGFCGRSCAGAACDPIGACQGELVLNAKNRAFDVNENGVAYVDQESSLSASLYWYAFGQSSAQLVDSSFLADQGASVLAHPELLLYASKNAAYSSQYPPAQARVDLFSGLGASIVGVANNQIYVGDLDGNGPKIARSNALTVTSYQLLCVPGYSDAKVAQDGVVYLSTSNEILVYNSGWASVGNCQSPVIGTTLVKVNSVFNIAIGATKLALTYSDSNRIKVALVDRTSGQLEDVDDVSTTTVGFDTKGLIAMNGDDLFYVKATLTPEDPSAKVALMHYNGTDSPKPMAAVPQWTSQITATSTHIYWSEGGANIYRVPR